ATFSSETASGWQSVNFPTAVAITANTTYVASYHTNVGNYGVDEPYFASAGIDNSPLHALSNAAGGGNGVYAYGNSAFPTQTFNSSNYWVDVVFASSGTADTTPPTVTSTTPAAGATAVATATTVTATFSEALTASTVTSSTFVLKDASAVTVPATVTYSGTTAT